MGSIRLNAFLSLFAFTSLVPFPCIPLAYSYPTSIAFAPTAYVQEFGEVRADGFTGVSTSGGLDYSFSMLGMS